MAGGPLDLAMLDAEMFDARFGELDGARDSFGGAEAVAGRGGGIP